MSNHRNICLSGNNSTQQPTANPSDMGQIFSYNGNNVTMRVQNGVVYVNLTEVAKAFTDKNLTNIINSQEISDYCKKFSKLQNCSLADLLIVKRGGNKSGTWAHHRVALRVAQKLSTEFSIWVDEKISELLTSGHCSIIQQYQIPQSYSEALMLAAKQAEQIEQAKQTINRLQPKADFADAAFTTDDKVDIGMAAKILKLGFGRNTLFQKLRQVGVFFSNRNEPKQRFVNAGYFEMKEKFIERNSHPGFVVTKILVTQKGLAYINHLFGGNPSDGKLTPIR